MMKAESFERSVALILLGRLYDPDVKITGGNTKDGMTGENTSEVFSVTKGSRTIFTISHSLKGFDKIFLHVDDRPMAWSDNTLKLMLDAVKAVKTAREEMGKISVQKSEMNPEQLATVEFLAKTK